MVKTVKNSFKNFVTTEDSLSSATVIIFVTYILSSIVGLLRTRVLAGIYGDSVELGIYYMSDKLPSFIYSVLILTVVTSAFVPVFTSYLEKNQRRAFNYTSNIITFSILFYLSIAFIVFVFSDFFSYLVSWGSLGPTSLNLMSTIMRIILVSQVVLIISGYLSSFLHSFKRFMIPSLVPIVYNAGVIFGTLVFSSDYGIYAPAYGMFIGTVVALIMQIPLVFYLGYRYKFRILAVTPGVIKSLKIAAPRMVAALAQRFYMLAIGGFISRTYFSPAYVVIYEFANQLQNMPVNAFGVSLSQALFPTVSSEVAKNNIGEVRVILGRYVLKMTYFMLPVVILFFVLRIPLVRILFGGDGFSWLGTNLTAYTLAFFSISMWFQAFGMILQRVFYAFQNSKIPTLVNILSMIFSFLLWFVFTSWLNYGVWSLALAFSLGSILNAILLHLYSTSLVGNIFHGYYFEYVKMLYATFICGVSTYLVLKYLDELVFDTTRTLPLVLLTGFILVLGGLVYTAVAELLGIRLFRDLVWKFYRKYS
jgi:putative peptidoglycan lipid II flippase